MPRATDLRARFRELHTARPAPHGVLVMPNPWDVGSAKILVERGATALATTSAGHAASLGRRDQHVDRAELLEHAALLCDAVDVPLSVDAEDCFADDVAGVEQTVRRLAAIDVAGFSIEDFDPRTGAIRSLDEAVARVAAARNAGDDLVLTARAENHLYAVDDLDDTIARLVAYHAAGADVVYAPGVQSVAQIERIVSAVDCPVNVLALPGTSTAAELAAIGVARISVGSLFAWAAYGALARVADELLHDGTPPTATGLLPGSLRTAAFS